MHAWEQIQATVDYIEDHIAEPFDIEKLANMAALSPFYYQRLFRRLVKKPPGEYIKLRRMAIATEELLEKDKRILDVALDLGFSTHEHFTRVFKKTFGITPEEYRKNPTTFNRMTKPQLLLHYTLIDENVPLISDGIVLEINRRQLYSTESFIGLTTKAPLQFINDLGTASGVDPLDTLWRAFHDQKNSIPALIKYGDEIGITYASDDDGFFNYFAGGQAEADTTAQGFQSWQLTPGEYIVCTFEAENFEHLVMDVLYKAHQYLFGTWLPRHGITTEPFSAERYQSHRPDTTQMEIWVKVKN